MLNEYQMAGKFHTHKPRSLCSRLHSWTVQRFALKKIPFGCHSKKVVRHKSWLWGVSPGRETKSLPLKACQCQLILLKFRKSFIDLESPLWDGSLEQRGNTGLHARGGKGVMTRPTANVSMLISWTHNRAELGCNPICICYTTEGVYGVASWIKEGFPPGTPQKVWGLWQWHATLETVIIMQWLGAYY